MSAGSSSHRSRELPLFPAAHAPLLTHFRDGIHLGTESAEIRISHIPLQPDIVMQCMQLQAFPTPLMSLSTDLNMNAFQNKRNLTDKEKAQC